MRCLCLIVIVLGAYGCAPITKDQCAAGDWRGIGFADGAAGRSISRLESIQKTCAKIGVVVDNVAYQEGRTEGLRQFCTPQNGLEVGLRGRSDPNMCPADLASNFAETNRAGKNIYDLRAKSRRLDREILSLGADLEDTDPDSLAYRSIQRQLLRLKDEQNLVFLELGRAIAHAEQTMQRITGLAYSL